MESFLKKECFVKHNVKNVTIPQSWTNSKLSFTSRIPIGTYGYVYEYTNFCINPESCSYIQWKLHHLLLASSLWNYLIRAKYTKRQIRLIFKHHKTTIHVLMKLFAKYRFDVVALLIEINKCTETSPRDGSFIHRIWKCYLDPNLWRKKSMIKVFRIQFLLNNNSPFANRWVYTESDHKTPRFTY